MYLIGVVYLVHRFYSIGYNKGLNRYLYILGCKNLPETFIVFNCIVKNVNKIMYINLKYKIVVQ